MAPNKYLTEIKPGIYKTKGLTSTSGKLDYSEIANKVSNPLSSIKHKSVNGYSRSSKTASAKK